MMAKPIGFTATATPTLDYLHHDKGGALTAERVEWAENVNCIQASAEKTERMWAQLVDDAPELKRQAGGSSRGRRLEKPYGQYVWSWHPDDNPSREHIRETVADGMKKLGLAQCQYRIVVHRDTDHVHAHVIVCRVHPENGRAMGRKNDGDRLREWSLDYEKAQGRIRVPGRLDDLTNRRRHAREKRNGQRPTPASPAVKRRRRERRRRRRTTRDAIGRPVVLTEVERREWRALLRADPTRGQKPALKRRQTAARLEGSAPARRSPRGRRTPETGADAGDHRAQAGTTAPGPRPRPHHGRAGNQAPEAAGDHNRPRTAPGRRRPHPLREPGVQAHADAGDHRAQAGTTAPGPRPRPRRGSRARGRTGADEAGPPARAPPHRPGSCPRRGSPRARGRAAASRPRSQARAPPPRRLRQHPRRRSRVRARTAAGLDPADPRAEAEPPGSDRRPWRKPASRETRHPSRRSPRNRRKALHSSRRAPKPPRREAAGTKPRPRPRKEVRQELILHLVRLHHLPVASPAHGLTSSHLFIC